MIKFVDKKQAQFITHSGVMHADEVIATAFLELYFEKLTLARVSEIDASKYSDNIIIYDIGRGKYDHHMNESKERENKIKYSSLGLLWEEFGKKYLEKINIEEDIIDQVYEYIEKDLIEQIDAIDNGQFPQIDAPYKVKTLSDVYKIFNPSVFSNQNENEQFLKAVNFSKELLINEINHAVSKVKSIEIVNNLLNKNEKKYLLLDKPLPYLETLLKHEKGNNILFVIFPSERGGYNIKTVPKSYEDKTYRLSFPKEWGGKTKEELQKLSNFDGLVFVHSTLFIAVTTTKEEAIALVEKLIKEGENNENNE